ncbi:MAG: DUF1553 domain-containing protein, partial [Planctomycetaceae bacterium]|nr:DUF1553 domain-containing protein [Planctomycetaceae bacterium]
GYEKDRPRSIWPYRDWVIRAINADMPYDQFTVEQLAGDMLPHATQDQRVATGFHRNTMLNEEGGIDPLEFRFYAMVDRVATTGLVWMGLTTGCAQCHSHKYDPISHTDYYRLMALLNNADEPDLILEDAATLTRQQELASSIAKLESQLPSKFPPDGGDGSEVEQRLRHFQEQFTKWLEAERQAAVKWTVLPVTQLETNLPRLEVLDDGSIFSTGDITKRDVFTLQFDLSQMPEPVTALRLEVLPDDRLPAQGPGRCYYEGRQGDFFLSELNAQVNGAKVPFASGSHSYGKISIGNGSADAANVFDGEGSTGWSTSGQEGRANHLVLNFEQAIPAEGELQIEMIFERHFAASLGRFRISATTAKPLVAAKPYPAEIESLLAKSPDSVTEEEMQQLQRQYLYIAPELAEDRKPIENLKKQIPEPVTSLVMQERPADNPRPTSRHHRGEYLSTREDVSAGVPKLFDPLPESEPANRLTFARWLVSDRNPLVGRVTVNRSWRTFFGDGLVRTNGDYGTQSKPPPHPELLDWLAVEFMENGWSIKRLHRLIVTSRTYQQSSELTPELLKRDPANELLARGPRYWIDAELDSDGMLSAAGLLSHKMLGASVYPPQPESVTALAYGNSAWPISQGEERYRRSLYTFSKRTAPFAAFAVFDAPSGENCLARRDRSNTPLQALTLLNDEMYLEMARSLAQRVVQNAADDIEVQATAIFRRLVTRPPSLEELSALVEFYQTQKHRLEQGELSADKITGQENSNAELAAWTMVARAVMNLDEAVIKP